MGPYTDANMLLKAKATESLLVVGDGRHLPGDESQTRRATGTEDAYPTNPAAKPLRPIPPFSGPGLTGSGWTTSFASPIMCRVAASQAFRAATVRTCEGKTEPCFVTR